jgi:hypothetical protein
MSMHEKNIFAADIIFTIIYSNELWPVSARKFLYSVQ